MAPPPHSQIIKNSFTALGESYNSFPHPSPQSLAEVDKNVAYCKVELRRLDLSVAWVNSSTHGLHVKEHLEPVLAGIAMVASDKNASQLTSLMKNLLHDLQPLACRIISAIEEAADFIKIMLEAQLAAARALRVLCYDNMKASKYLEVVETVTKASLENRRRLDLQNARAAVRRGTALRLEQEQAAIGASAAEMKSQQQKIEESDEEPEYVFEYERRWTRVSGSGTDEKEIRKHRFFNRNGTL